MRLRHLVVIFVGVGLIAFAYICYTQGTLDKAIAANQAQNPVAYFARISSAISLLTFLVTFAAAATALWHLHTVRYNNTQQAMRQVLDHYIEDPKVFELGNRVRRHMPTVNKLIRDSRTLYLRDLQLMDVRIRKITHKELSYDDIRYLVNSFNHLSWTINNQAPSDEFKRDFYPPVMRHWPELRCFIEFEHARREDTWWAKEYYSLAQHMETQEFRESLRKAGLQPFPPVNHILWVFGTTCSGKSELLRHLTEDCHIKRRLTRLLDIQDHKLTRYPREMFQDITYLPQLFTETTGCVLLIEGRLSDLSDNKVLALSTAWPWAYHRIIYLSCEKEKLLERRAERGANTSAAQHDTEVSKYDQQVGGLLEAGFAVARIDSTTRRYAIEKWQRFQRCSRCGQHRVLLTKYRVCQKCEVYYTDSP